MSYPLTNEGFQNIKKELDHLKKVERPEIIERIAIARSHGDLSENAEYHSAREKQGMIEARIKYLEGVIAEAEVIDPTKLSGDRVLFGATVTIFDSESEDETTYKLVGELESDLNNGKLSVTSPIGAALIGKEIGDEVVVQTPAGRKVYEIMEVEFV